MVVTAHTNTVPVPSFGIHPHCHASLNQNRRSLSRLQMLSGLVPDLAPPPGFQGSWPSEGQLLRQLSAHASEAAGKPSGIAGILAGCAFPTAIGRMKRIHDLVPPGSLCPSLRGSDSLTLAAGGSQPGFRVVLQPDPHVLSLRERMGLGAAGSMPCRWAGSAGRLAAALHVENG